MFEVFRQSQVAWWRPAAPSTRPPRVCLGSSDGRDAPVTGIKDAQLHQERRKKERKKKRERERQLVTQSCPTLCNPMDYNLLGSSVYGILQAKIMEWVANSFSR